MRHRSRLFVPALVAVLALPFTACSSDDDATDDGPTTTAAPPTEPTTTTTPRPEGPASVLTPLSLGTPILPLTAKPGPDLAAAGYEETEYIAVGAANSYSGELPADGRFALEVGDAAPYGTRVIIRRPAAPADFSGTVVVEWLNVSSGNDAAPDYAYLGEEIVRRGDAWVGVSAQHIGIEGGPVAVPIAVNPGAGAGLKHQDEARYGAMEHPGDAFMYDIYTQVARSLRDDEGPLADLDVTQVLAAGESQSAFTLTTYANGVQPLTRQFDGFLIHSRGGAAAPLGSPGAGVGIADAILGTPTIIRTDLDVPVLIVQTETDVLGVLGYLPARQDDTDRIRLWEIAGTAHADSYQLGPVEPALGCSLPINRGQQVYVLRAAYDHLVAWAAGGEAPPEAPRLDVSGDGGPAAAFLTDESGNVTGGVRTPAVDAAVDKLSGAAAPDSSIACTLMGTTTPIAPDVLAARYADRAAYTQAYADATDAAIDAGFLLDADRDAIIAEAQPDRVAE